MTEPAEEKYVSIGKAAKMLGVSIGPCENGKRTACSRQNGHQPGIAATVSPGYKN